MTDSLPRKYFIPKATFTALVVPSASGFPSKDITLPQTSLYICLSLLLLVGKEEFKG